MRTQPNKLDMIPLEEIKAKCMIDLSKPLPSRYERQKDWIVYEDGSMLHTERDYTIDAEDLKDKDWILHLLGKSWIDLNTFIPAYFHALSVIGTREITITTSHEN
jgi:hypothetical protein